METIAAKVKIRFVMEDLFLQWERLARSQKRVINSIWFLAKVFHILEEPSNLIVCPFGKIEKNVRKVKKVKVFLNCLFLHTVLMPVRFIGMLQRSKRPPLAEGGGKRIIIECKEFQLVCGGPSVER